MLSTIATPVNDQHRAYLLSAAGLSPKNQKLAGMSKGVATMRPPTERELMSIQAHKTPVHQKKRRKEKT